MKELRTIVLAAGKGTRMKSSVPKVLHEVCGRAMIDYVMDAVKAVGSSKIFIVLGHQSAQVKAHLRGAYEVILQRKLLGTADAVNCTKRTFQGFRGDVLVICGDTPLIKKETVRGLVRQHRRSGASCTFLTAVVPSPHGYGRVIRGIDGKVAAIREEADAAGLEKHIAEVNAGVYCFKAEALFENLERVKANKTKKEFYLTDIVEIITSRELKVETRELEDIREGLGVNTREDLSISEKVIRKRLLREFMLQGVTIIDPQTTYIHANVRIGRDTIVRPFTFIESGVQVGGNCTIGPFARLRSGTRIGNGVVLGNFVEVSRSRVSDYCVMKHFGFLGDATLEKYVNVGAGVVTANYDGKKKNKAYIAQKAFLGSDSILVAPVRIGKEAVVGAGCVVTRGKIIPDRSVVVGVPGKIIKQEKK